MRVVVTGGLGNLGRAVVSALQDGGHEAVIASRRTGVDLRTGAGLAECLRDADAAVHTADSLRPWHWKTVTLGGTRALAETAAGLPAPPHLVYISIVGVDRNPYPYYRAKLAAEQVLADAPVPATVVRATQFHSLAAVMAGMRLGPVAVGVRGLSIQPVDITWVGRRLAEIAVSSRPDGFTRARELAGPDRFEAAEITDLVAAHLGTSAPRRLEMPPLGATLKAFAAGAVLPRDDAEIGGERFTEWLARQGSRLPRR